MWPFGKKKEQEHVVGRVETPILLTNTLTEDKERFSPLKAGEVSLYSCGPTVYGPQHIGNLRSAVFSDALTRMLTSAGYTVKKVVNITDVGHLVGDGDDGEDKMQVGAKRENTTPEAIAERYTKQYLEDIAALNIDTSTITFPRASEYIKEQIAMIQTLEEKGYAYHAEDGVYFDTDKYEGYGKLGGIMKVKLMAGARVKMVGGKRGLHDFALWRHAKPHDLQVWDSPWGKGNPGWSIECSAMIRATLGQTIDIHTGGEDHIGVHHNNEIAQSENANGKPLARIWMHHAFLTIAGEKIAKSAGNTYVLDDVRAKHIDPLALRYFFMQAHYKTPLSFTWEALAASQEALMRLWKRTQEVKTLAEGTSEPSAASLKIEAYLRDDLAIPQALASLNDALRDTTLSPTQVWGAIEAAEGVLGLSLTNPPKGTLTLQELPPEVQKLALEREEARTSKDFARSDELRIHIQNSGYQVDDGPSGTIYTESHR